MDKRCLYDEYTMNNEPKFPAWLSFVERAPDEGQLLRLMVLNPFNDAVSVMLNRVIDADPPRHAPGPSDLHTSAHPRP